MARDPNTLTAKDLAAALAAEDDAPEMESAAPAAPTPSAPVVDPLDRDGDGRKGGAKPGQRLKKGAAPVDESTLTEQVVVRITKAGHSEVHDGNEGRYDWNDEVVLPLGVARELEARGRAEIVGNA